MKNIAIIGTSPIMLILANYFCNKKIKVTIFDDSKKIGGSWSYYNFKNNFISTQTNVIVPDNIFEEKNIPIINSYLKKKFSIKISINKDKFLPLGYLAKTNYEYKLNSIYKKIKNSKKIKIKKKFINNVESINNYVLINKKNKFDKIFIPTYCGIDKIKINKKTYDISPKLIVSEHVMIIAKKIRVKHLAYSESFDHNFDRAQIKKIKNYNVFTARVSKEKKGLNVLSLIKDSNLLYSKKDLVKVVKTKYKNYYRDHKQRDYLNKLTTNTNIEYINTALFVESFFSINDKFKLTKHKYRN